MTTLPERFRVWARRQPSAQAILTVNDSLTYAEVDQRSDDLARELAEAGVAAGSLVGLHAGRGAHVLIAILGVLKHGCAYVPVDTADPRARVELVRESLGLRWTLTEDSTTEAGLRLDETGSRHAPGSVHPGLAYVIHTSGSTGRPKAVAVSHANVISLLDASRDHFDWTPDDVWSMYHSHCFDLSVWEMWAAWNSGGSVLVVPKPFVRTAPLLLELLDRRKASMVTLVPTAFHHLTRALDASPRRLPALRDVILAGEPVKLDVVDRWRELVPLPARVINMYGITEITIHATFTELNPGQPARYPGTTPIGRPLSHLDIRLVDDEGTEVAAGQAGEIIVVGEGVAAGYLNDADTTRSRFRSDEVGRPTYRSGDFAVRDAGGGLHFLGRRDDQVKIKGYRVETAEVSAAVEQHPEVAACVVTTPETANGARELVAHCVLRSEPGPDTAHLLRQHVVDLLPVHMVPDDFVFHTELPMTPNGKADKVALEQWRADSRANRCSVVPR
jgi:amino acid adenylation domain-containing protein